MRYVVIMAGGSGTRLWPLSRQGTPKQLLPLIGGRSLLQLAFERSLASVPADRILVVTGAAYADQVIAQLPGLQAQNVLGEPVGRDSLNAVAWPAAVLARTDPDAVIAQVTAFQSRHRFARNAALLSKIRLAPTAAVAENADGPRDVGAQHEPMVAPADYHPVTNRCPRGTLHA